MSDLTDPAADKQQLAETTSATPRDGLRDLPAEKRMSFLRSLQQFAVNQIRWGLPDDLVGPLLQYVGSVRASTIAALKQGLADEPEADYRCEASTTAQQDEA